MNAIKLGQFSSFMVPLTSLGLGAHNWGPLTPLGFGISQTLLILRAKGFAVSDIYIEKWARLTLNWVHFCLAWSHLRPWALEHTIGAHLCNWALK